MRFRSYNRPTDFANRTAVNRLDTCALLSLIRYVPMFFSDHTKFDDEYSRKIAKILNSRISRM